MLNAPEAQVQVDLDVKLPKPATRLLKQAKESASRAAEARERAADATRKAAEALVEAGVSHRDVGELLGVTRQRPSQILTRS